MVVLEEEKAVAGLVVDSVVEEKEGKVDLEVVLAEDLVVGGSVVVQEVDSGVGLVEVVTVDL